MAAPYLALPTLALAQQDYFGLQPSRLDQRSAMADHRDFHASFSIA
jgi:hypothetical protein